MIYRDTRKLNPTIQYLISTAIVVIVSLICFVFLDLISYRIVALILLLTVSILAMLFDILPVLCGAVLSALIWNFFFIPPRFTFHIDNAEDWLMFLMYLAIAMINAVMTIEIRKQENHAREKEEKVNMIKLYDTLLNSLSHELKTPIATILGAIDTLKESKDKLSENYKTELLSQIDTAGMRLNRQVENLLDMSRLESGMMKLNIDWCDINELVFSVLHKLSVPDLDHKILFDPDKSLPLFKIDAGLIEQVIYNIVSNAIQYTPPKSTITINASYKSDQCILYIADNGNGFPVNEIQYVFDKFYRLPNSKTGGSGLGLSIAKGFVEAHHGVIRLENNATGGAKFTLSLPVETSFINHLKNE